MTRNLHTLFNLSLLSIVLLVISTSPALSDYRELTETDYTIEVVASELDRPWSLAFLPDGRLLVTERSGQLRIIDNGVVSEPVLGVPAVFAKSQGGLFDVVLHPDYAQNQWIYLSYAYGDDSANATRLARAKLDGNALVDLEVLFTASPWKNTPVHYGGRFAFIKGNKLLLGIGDGFDFREMAQLTNSHTGSIVRLNDDGSIPTDNPFVDASDAQDAIWTYGHRNPQAIVYDNDLDIVYAHEHGPAGGDELNVIVRGRNYGWPIATYGRDYSGAEISPFTEYCGTSQPILHWTPSIAPGGMALVKGDAFPMLQGNLLVAALKAREVRRLHVNDDGTITQQSLFKELGQRIRDVRVADDGSLYLLTDSNEGQVLRVTEQSQ